MTKKEILNYLEQNKDERGIRHWEKAGVGGMSSVGIGVTKLKAFAKKSWEKSSACTGTLG